VDSPRGRPDNAPVALAQMKLSVVAKAIARSAAGELPKAMVGQKQWRSRYQRANRDSSRGCWRDVREAL
jgi:hypothetical protein